MRIGAQRRRPLVAVARLVRPERPAATGRTDVAGATLLTAGVVLIVTAVSQAAGGLSVAVGGAAAAGAALLTVFFLVEQRVADPMVRLSLLRAPQIRYGNLLCLVGAGSGLAATWFGTLYMQNVLGMGPLATGLGFVPLAVVLVAASARSGWLVARFGVRALLLAATALIWAGLLLLGLVDAGGTYATHVLPGFLLVGAGAGLSYAPILIVGTSGVPDRDQGLASGL